MNKLSTVTALLELVSGLIDLIEGQLGGKAKKTKRVEDLLSSKSKAKLQDLRADALRKRLTERKGG